MRSVRVAINRPWLGYVAAVLAVTALVLVYYEFRHKPEEELGEQMPLETAVIEFDRFSARVERSDGTERLAVTMRLRANVRRPIDCFVFVVARSERAKPRTWVIWPGGNPGLAISSGGHFHAAQPT